MKDKRRLIAERLEYLRRRSGGRLTPAAVVADARDPKSVLHRNAGFQWDLRKAAYRQWIEHARTLIADAVVVVRDRNDLTFESHAFVRNATLSPREQGYVSVLALRKDKREARLAMNYELKRLISYVERVEGIAKTLGLSSMVRAVLEDLLRLQEKLAA